MTAKRTDAGSGDVRRKPRHASPRSGEAGSAIGYEPQRRHMIEEAAYFLAEQRGFAPGYEMSDWLQAEADIERLITRNA